MTEQTTDTLRLDKWLWAARFFKTRANASTAVAGGKVHVNGRRVKPAKPIAIGDRLRIRRGTFEFTVTVAGLSARRRQASEAATLYEETDASRARRAEIAAQRRAARAQGARATGRPDKKARRALRRIKHQR